MREVPATGLRDTIIETVDFEMSLEEEPGHRFGVWVPVPFTHATSAVANDTVLIVADNRRFEIQVWSFEGELAAMRRQFRGERRLPSLPVHGRRMPVDADRNIWIEAWSNDQLVPSSEWHVFQAESERFVGTVEMPPRFRPTAIYVDAVLGVHKDDLDVESVREYPIIR